jgi:hypothetical protein
METVQHTDVVEALAAIMGEMPGIEKSKKQGAGINYAFRGIEDITPHVQNLLAKHGVVIVPRAELLEIAGITKNGNPWTQTRIQVTSTIYGPNSTEIPGPTMLGFGDDNSDKGANKAETQAYKYILIQLFCVADPASDTDAIPAGETDRRDIPSTEPAVPNGWTSYEESLDAHNTWAERVGPWPDNKKAAIKAFRAELSPTGEWPLPTKDDFDKLVAYTDLVEVSEAV